MTKSESKYFNTASKMDDALIFLLERKTFEFITVKDVCKAANVNRSTFYLHYTNTCDLLEETIERLSESFNSHFDTNKSGESIVNSPDLNDLYLINDSFLIPYLDFIKENKKIFKAITANPEIFKVDKTYKKLFKSVFSPIMKRFGLDEKWHKYLMDFYIQGISSFILDWVADDCNIPSNEIAKFIEGLIVKRD